MSKEDLYSIIPVVGKKLIEKEKEKSKNIDTNIEVVEKTTTEAILPFENVLDNMLLIEKGNYRMIAKTNAISIEDMDEKDKKTVLEVYHDLQNSLTKPHQIYIPSFTLDIREHLSKLDERIEEEGVEGIIEWLEDDKNFQKSLVEENDIIDTQFYYVFESDFKPSNNDEKDFLRAKKELSKTVKFTSDELEGIGLYVNALNREEVGRLLYYGLNPFSVGIQEPDFEEVLVTGRPTEKKSFQFKKKISPNENEEPETFELKNVATSNLKDGALDFKSKIAPYAINDKMSGDFIKVGSAFMTVYEVYDYRKNMPNFWAKKLYKFRNNIDISIHVKPMKTSEIVNELDKAAVNFGSATVDHKTGKKRKATTMIDKRMESTAHDIDKIMDELDSDQNFFHFSMYILAKAKSLEELDDLCLELENVIGSMKVSFRKTSENMRNALWSVMPFGLNLLGTTRNMLTDGVANSFPFTNFSFTHKDAPFLATHKYNMSFINFNPFKLHNANGAVLGESGAGKSVASKKLVKGLTTVNDYKLRVTDPEGEHIEFAKSIDGIIVDFFAGSKHRLNILEPEPDDEVDSLIKPTTNSVKSFLEMILDLEKSDRSKIDYSLIQLYNSFGFYDDKETYWDDRRKDDGIFYLGRPRRKPPELYDLLKAWEENRWIDVIGDTKELANQLREWTRLGSIDLFDGPTNVDFKAKRVFYNLKHLDKQLKIPGMYVLFNKLKQSAMKNPDEKEIHLYEEAHVLMKDDIVGQDVYDANKRIRKYGGCNIFVTQNISDYYKTKWGPEVLKNCAWSILLRQAKDDMDQIQSTYQMLESEARRMTKFNPKKGEAYLIADNFRIPINIRVSDKELEVFKTS